AEADGRRPFRTADFSAARFRAGHVDALETGRASAVTRRRRVAARRRRHAAARDRESAAVGSALLRTTDYRTAFRPAQCRPGDARLPSWTRAAALRSRRLPAWRQVAWEGAAARRPLEILPQPFARGARMDVAVLR